MTPDNLLQWRVEYGVVDFEVGVGGKHNPNGSPLLVAGPSESLDEMARAKELLDRDDVSKDGGGLSEPSFRAIVTRVVSEWIRTPERGGNQDEDISMESGQRHEGADVR